MSYIIVHKFAVVFGLPSTHAHRLALGIVAVTSVYVVFGGFKGVILSEFLQTVVLFAVAFIVGFVCYQQYSAEHLHAAVTHGSGSGMVTPAYWKSLMPEATPKIGMFSAAAGYKGWQDFIGATLAFSIVGMIGCVGGAGGRYGEQRFLAATNAKEAAKLAALWQFLGFPRWIMTAGLCFVGYTLYTSAIASDPECVMPKFLQSGLLAPGLLGLVVAGLSASFMTSFCSEINACASIIVRDLYQPLIAPHVADSDRRLVKVSYIVTGCLAALAALIGYTMIESQARGGGIENASPAAAINEMLLQSHEDVIRLFPSWPKNLDARADGAFLVSAELRGGVVSRVTIQSEKGRDCVIENPWPERAVKVMRNGKVTTASGPRFTLKTSPGETLKLEAE
jgi:Na+/proline symporter